MPPATEARRDLASPMLNSATGAPTAAGASFGAVTAAAFGSLGTTGAGEGAVSLAAVSLAGDSFCAPVLSDAGALGASGAAEACAVSLVAVPLGIAATEPPGAGDLPALALRLGL